MLWAVPSRAPGATVSDVRATWTAIEATAAPVLADFERSDPGRVRLAPPDELDGPEAILWDADGGGMGTGLWLGDAHEEPWEAVLEMTAQIQDAAFDHLWRTWPECPEHPGSHPLDPGSRGRQAVWRCPANDRVIADVGNLKAGE